MWAPNMLTCWKPPVWIQWWSLANEFRKNLVEAMAETNKKHKLVRRLPVLKEVVKWVDQAKKLPRVVDIN